MAALDLVDFQAVATLAELGHFGRAAERLGVSQPALTKRIRLVEERIGGRLFERLARGVRLTADDRFRGEIIERLMCDFEVDLGEITTRYGRSPRDIVHELSRLESFAADGLVRSEGSRLKVTEAGRLVVRSICAVFDVYFREAEGRHSRAL